MAAMNDDVDVPRITVIGVCSVVAVYVFITLTRVAFMQLEDEQTQIKLIDSKPRTLVKYQEEQHEKLGGGYRWSDEKARTVHLPIDIAMAKVTQELASSHKLDSAPSHSDAVDSGQGGLERRMLPSPNATSDGPKQEKARRVPTP
ncbi:MAG: hypothetical protein ACAI38_11890 [Myxococcota bacterium]